MGMTRGTPLVATVAAVVKLTGQQNLDNIPDGSELTMTDLLTTASDYVYDRLEANGIDPTLLSNQTVYERSVAFQFLSILAAAGLLIVDDESAQESEARYQARSDLYFEQVRPKSSADDMSPTGLGHFPRIANTSRNPRLAPSAAYDDLLSIY